jgi:hypothetical protein
MGGAAEGAAKVLVEPGEEICRLCFSADVPICDNQYPNQIDPETGLIRLEELSWTELRKRGFSVQERRKYSYAEAVDMAARREAGKLAKGINSNYKLAGVLISRVAEITGITDERASQVFRVIATPTVDQPGHAEIRLGESFTRDDLLKFRVNLQAALGKLLDGKVLDHQEG